MKKSLLYLLFASAAFAQWIEREFPQGASEWEDPVSRRHFVKIMSASFLLAGLGLDNSKLANYSFCDVIWRGGEVRITTGPPPGG